MINPGDKEKKEDDPVVQVVDNLNNAIEDLDLADSELDKDLDDIKSSTNPDEDVGDGKSDDIDSILVQTPPRTVPDPTVQTQNDDPQDQADPNSTQQSSNDNWQSQDLPEPIRIKEIPASHQDVDGNATTDQQTEGILTTQTPTTQTNVYQRPGNDNS